MLSLSNISYSIHVFLKPQIQSCLVFVLCTLIETAKVHHQASSSNRPGSVSEVILIQQASLSIGESTQGIDVESAVPEETAELSPTLLESNSAMLQSAKNELSTQQNDVKAHNYNDPRSDVSPPLDIYPTPTSNSRTTYRTNSKSRLRSRHRSRLRSRSRSRSRSPSGSEHTCTFTSHHKSDSRSHFKLESKSQAERSTISKTVH